MGGVSIREGGKGWCARGYAWNEVQLGRILWIGGGEGGVPGGIFNLDTAHQFMKLCHTASVNRML